MPYPISTRDGALSATCSGLPFAVLPYLPGHAPPWPEWPLALRDELARTIAAIHHATPAVADVLPPRETFAIPFAADLRRGEDRQPEAAGQGLEHRDRIGEGRPLTWRSGRSAARMPRSPSISVL